jgi:hypothetical protein
MERAIELASKPEPHKRSLRLTVYCWILIGVNALLVLFYGITLFMAIITNALTPLGIALLTVITVVMLVEILFCIFMLKLKKWALKGFIGMSAFGILFQLIQFNFIAPLIRVAFLYLILSKDWEHFE